MSWIGKFIDRYTWAQSVGYSKRDQVNQGISDEKMVLTHWFDHKTDYWIPRGATTETILTKN
ncbi:MAG: hypothetical protein AAGJ29_00860 [Pseudomonadota bacterium]